MAKSATFKRHSDLSMNYDDDDDELSPLNGQRTLQESKPWDVFREMPVKQDTGSMESPKWLDVGVKAMKVLAYLLVFAIVLGSAVVSKGSLLFMTSQLKRNKIVSYCNIQLGIDRQFVSTLPNEERLAWLWCILCVFAVPEVGTFIRSARIAFFKSVTNPTKRQFLLVFLTETLHTIGLVILAFWILPYMDVLKGLMLTNCMCIIPGILSLMSRNKKEPRRAVVMIADILAIGAQLTGAVAWPLLYDNVNIWLIPLAVIFISIGWWENFVSEDSPIGFIKSLGRLKEELNYCRYTIYRIIPIWKMGLFLCCILISLWIEGEDPNSLFHNFHTIFGPRNIPVEEIEVIIGNQLEVENVTMTGDVIYMPVDFYTPVYVMLIQILATYLCYIFGKFACKIGIQGFSYALPINLVVPVCVNLAIAACGLRNSDPCAFHNFIPDYLFFTSPPVYFLHEYVTGELAWIWLLWLFSQTWITIHIWSSKSERLASTERIFVNPMYNAILIDQSMALNRRQDGNVDVKKEDFEAMEKEKMAQYYDNISLQTDGSGSFQSVKSSDHITRIYACATMWHETRDEMMEFLKSIVRIDEDQCARRVAQKYLRIVDPDYYEFETHIFLDDAYELSDHSDDDSQVNRFVKLLINTIDEAASEVHQTNIRIRPPKKYPTPYGGRLVWILPGKTKMICHLKDKAKIRHRKRWSQVMYMYYLLGHRLMELPIPVDRKEVMAENTYLLALDGDIDFKPQAVTLLIDLMKRNKNLGAACGRIHPVGDGPMVWYQKFEYAIGHWLQKATEHMIGCVLCSPGCFSLFRGKALMDDNIMKKYTLQSDQARHYVQYDQGEDRWLCTLILQRGYRVEYSAASDAYTHAPEGFNEFFNQRRRWVPSTMANILDLLADSKYTIKVNDNISMLYILYQVLLMIGTVLGPGTIFLMLVGAFNSAFRIDNLTAFYFNIVPIILFMIVCYFCKSEVQLMVAGLLSCFYGLVMAAVFVGIALQIMEDGWLAPTSLFFAMTILVFVITALMHPAEIGCLLSIFVYYITIPSMYMLLVLYSIFNMNNVTWGTREVVQKLSAKEVEQEKEEMKNAMKKAKKNTFLSYLQSKSQNESEGSVELSCAGLFKCLFCTHPKPAPEQVQLVQIANHLEKIEKKIEGVERSVDPQGLFTNRRRTSVGIRSGELLNSVIEDAEDQIDSESETSSLAAKEERDGLINPYWIEDPDLKKGEVDFLTTTEIQFWKDLIEKYLYPIDEDKEEKARISKDLKDLRDRSVFAFFMINALFVLVLFLLQLNQDELHIQWPFGGQTNVTYDELVNHVTITQEYLQLEPLGLAFVLFFGVVMVIQFIAMLFHRFGTLAHLLSSAELNWYFNNKSKDYSDDGFFNKNAVAIVKDLQKLDGFDENDTSEDQVGRRKTIHNLENARQKKNTVSNLDAAFKKRFFNLNSEDPTGGAMRKITLRRDTLRALETRRDSLIAVQRQSQMYPNERNNYYNSATTQPRRTRASLTSSDMYGDSNNGRFNRGYEPALEEDDVTQQLPRKSQVTFQMSY